jgi:hypothetical protein
MAGWRTKKSTPRHSTSTTWTRRTACHAWGHRLSTQAFKHEASVPLRLDNEKWRRKVAANSANGALAEASKSPPSTKEPKLSTKNGKSGTVANEPKPSIKRDAAVARLSAELNAHALGRVAVITGLQAGLSHETQLPQLRDALKEQLSKHAITTVFFEGAAAEDSFTRMLPDVLEELPTLRVCAVCGLSDLSRFDASWKPWMLSGLGYLTVFVVDSEWAHAAGSILISVHSAHTAPATTGSWRSWRGATRASWSKYMVCPRGPKWSSLT